MQLVAEPTTLAYAIAAASEMVAKSMYIKGIVYMFVEMGFVTCRHLVATHMVMKPA